MKFPLIICASLLFASPAIAQRQVEELPGSHIIAPRAARIPTDLDVSDADRGRLAMGQYARCTVDREMKPLAKLLALPADKLTLSQIRTLARDECLDSGQISFQPLLLRGAIFVELYRRREIALSRGVAWRLPVTAFDDKAPIEADDQQTRVQLGLLGFANCVVGRDPVASRAVILSPSVSAQEDAQFIILRSSLSSCLPQGRQIKLSKPALEGAIAEILYRASAAKVPVAPTGAK